MADSAVDQKLHAHDAGVVDHNGQETPVKRTDEEAVPEDMDEVARVEKVYR